MKGCKGAHHLIGRIKLSKDKALSEGEYSLIFACNKNDLFGVCDYSKAYEEKLKEDPNELGIPEATVHLQGLELVKNVFQSSNCGRLILSLGNQNNRIEASLVRGTVAAPRYNPTLIRSSKTPLDMKSLKSNSESLTFSTYTNRSHDLSAPIWTPSERTDSFYTDYRGLQQQAKWSYIYSNFQALRKTI